MELMARKGQKQEIHQDTGNVLVFSSGQENRCPHS